MVVLGAGAAAMMRFDSSDSATVVGRAGVSAEVPVGASFPLQSESVVGQVYRTGCPARIDDYEGLDSELAAAIRRAGFRNTVAAPVTVSGRLWGAVIVGSDRAEPLPPYTEDRLADFAELVALALASADARAELSRSRARLVATSDTERRRLERNLHDGAQQRLVTLALSLRLAEARIDSDPEAARELMAAASEELDLALGELRELARGIHPGMLTGRGLGPALESLTERAPIPVHLEIETDRLDEAVEVAAYYVVAEALANAIRYADADSVDVRVERRDGSLHVEVADTGRGGADPDGGTGLRGLVDRVETLGGHLSVESAPGSGTRVRAELPVA
jgi:signal transduction histidine kinase